MEKGAEARERDQGTSQEPGGMKRGGTIKHKSNAVGCCASSHPSLTEGGLWKMDLEDGQKSLHFTQSFHYQTRVSFLLVFAFQICVSAL